MRQFRDIKQGAPVYILDTSEMTLTQGIAGSISGPRVETNPKTGKPEMMITVTVDAPRHAGPYTMPEDLSVAYAGNIVLATDKQDLAKEAEASLARAKQILEQKERAERVVERAPNLLAELNPQFKEKRDTERRFEKIEGTLTRLEEMLGGLCKDLKG